MTSTAGIRGGAGANAAARYVGRFAPSPTGPLHFGSLVAALASYLDARANRGTWLLRIEDVDTERCRTEHTDNILRTLVAHGFCWDAEPILQSQRDTRYHAVLAQLLATKAAYACECTRREIADTSIGGIDGPVYQGTCRHKQLPDAGRTLRFIVPAGQTQFIDRLHGLQQQCLSAEVGDFVVRRRGQQSSYQLAVVVDDVDSQVTHVVRGADLLDSTARQIALQQRLGFPTPQYLHLPVATNGAGEKWSKQTLAPAIGSHEAATNLRQALAFLGQTGPPQVSTPRQILDWATTHWRPDAITASRTKQHLG